jgi:hypothetical protein
MVRRLATALILAALATGLMLTAGVVGATETATAAARCDGGTSASELNALIRGKSRGPAGMVGMDYAHAHALPDGRVLWVFQDVFLGNVKTLDKAKFVHNAALVQLGSCVRLLRSGSSSDPRSWLGAAQEKPKWHWFWPLGGTMGADGFFHQFVVEMNNPNGTGAAVGAVPERMWIATIRLRDLKVVRFEPAPDAGERPLYGFSVVDDEQYTYLYGNCYRQFTNPGYVGSHDTDCGPKTYVARVPRGSVFSAPEYWAGTGWSSDRTAAVPVMERGWAANPMQVRRFGSTFVSVTKIDDWWGNTVYIDTAAEATGPWSEAGRFSADLVCADCSNYFAQILPWGDARGRMLVSISNNTWNFADAVRQPLNYRPRVFAVRVPDGVVLPAPPPDCGITATLKPGMRTAQVRCLRRRLAQFGYRIDAREVGFGPSTLRAVRAFQSGRGLNPDGLVGRDTGMALGIRDVRSVSGGRLA